MLSAAVLTAAEVDQALRAINERREEVRSDDVDGQDLRSRVDAVMDHGVHADKGG